jgi:urease accessory protein
MQPPTTQPDASTVLTLTQRYPANLEMPTMNVAFTLSLTAEERTRSRHYVESIEGQPLYLNFPRGTVLQQGDILAAEHDDRRVRVLACPELVLTVTATTPLDLLRAAYHLGNRHVSLEVAPTYLRLAPDPVLKDMLEHLGLRVIKEEVPFHPESGAYGHHHTH